MKNSLLYFLAGILIAGTLPAQDLHFSMYQNTPLYYNPSSAGAFPGEHRATINHKNQWKAIDVNYQHNYLSYEKNLFMKQNGNHLGVGVMVLNDRSGTGLLNQNYAALSTAYHINVAKNNFLSAGIQVGFGQRSLNYSNLSWDNQFSDNFFNTDLPSGENVNTTKSFADVGAGVQWNALLAEKYNVNVGIAGFHLNSPGVSFMNDAREKLLPKYVFHSQALIPLPLSNTSIKPSIMYSMQGGHKEFIAGTFIRYELREASKYTGFIKGTAVYIGTHYRYKDALVFSAGVEMGPFQFGVSYDVNTSGFKNATKGRGGFEFNLKFTNPNPFLKPKTNLSAFF